MKFSFNTVYSKGLGDKMSKNLKVPKSNGLQVKRPLSLQIYGNILVLNKIRWNTCPVSI